MIGEPKVGDVLDRVMHGFRDELWRMDARVTKIEGNVVTCVVLVDYYRTMEFDLHTGINLLGPDYGWLEEKPK